MVSGGGVYNSFLVQTIQNKTKHKIIIPSKEIIEFKEALIFAFLAYLKIHGNVNVLQSVTGAKRDSSSGVLIS